MEQDGVGEPSGVSSAYTRNLEFILSVLRRFWRSYAKTEMIWFQFFKDYTAVRREQTGKEASAQAGRPNKIKHFHASVPEAI